jgi:hypothetical protein
MSLQSSGAKRYHIKGPALKRRCIVGEDPRTGGTRGNEIGLSWNGPISPTI